MSKQPRHHLPSFGRLDQPRQPEEMQIRSAPTPDQQAPQPDTVTVSSLKTLVDRLPAALREEVAAISARDLDTQQRLDAVSDLAARAKPSISAAVQAVTDRRNEADTALEQLVASKAAAVDNATYEQIRHRLHNKWSHAESPISSVQDSVEHAKPEELGVVLQEAKPWLENRGHPADFIPAVLARTDSEVGKAAAVQSAPARPSSSRSQRRR